MLTFEVVKGRMLQDNAHQFCFKTLSYTTVLRGYNNNKRPIPSSLIIYACARHILHILHVFIARTHDERGKENIAKHCVDVYAFGCTEAAASIPALLECETFLFRLACILGST